MGKPPEGYVDSAAASLWPTANAGLPTDEESSPTPNLFRNPGRWFAAAGEDRETTLAWGAKLTSDVPPLLPIDIYFLSSSALGLSMLPRLCPPGPIDGDHLKTAVEVGVAMIPLNPWFQDLALKLCDLNLPEIESPLQNKPTRLWARFWEWADKVLIPAMTDKEDPRLRRIRDRWTSYKREVLSKQWGKENPVAAIRATLKAQLPNGGHRGVAWQRLKEYAKTHQGISGDADFAISLLAGIHGKHCSVRVDGNGNYHWNWGKAVDTAISEMKKDQRRNEVPLDNLSQHAQVELVKDVAVVRIVQDLIQEGQDLGYATQAAKEYLLGKESRKEVAERYGITEEKIRYAENWLERKSEQLNIS